MSDPEAEEIASAAIPTPACDVVPPRGCSSRRATTGNSLVEKEIVGNQNIFSVRAIRISLFAAEEKKIIVSE